MAAPSTSLSRLGQINEAGADDALFLKQFGGEILTEFEQNNVFKNRHFVRRSAMASPLSSLSSGGWAAPCAPLARGSTALLFLMLKSC